MSCLNGRLCCFRHHKCKVCCKQLKNLSNMVKNKAAQVGRHGSAFKELQLLMAPLEDSLWHETQRQLTNLKLFRPTEIHQSLKKQSCTLCVDDTNPAVCGNVFKEVHLHKHTEEILLSPSESDVWWAACLLTYMLAECAHHQESVLPAGSLFKLSKHWRCNWAKCRFMHHY